MKAPTLSVIMSVFNHGRCVGNALNAILAQSRRPLEILVVDDASTDESSRIIGKFAARCESVRLVVNDKNVGVLINVNKLANLAQGDYIYGAAADDVVMPGFFEKALEMAASCPGTGIVFGKYIMADYDGRERIAEVPAWSSAKCMTPEMYLKDYLEHVSPISSFCGSTIYERTHLLEMGSFRPGLGAFADFFVARAIGLKYGACYIPHVCMRWNMSPDSFSAKSRKSLQMSLHAGEEIAGLMRSNEFNNFFPAPHVAAWEKGYRREVIRLFRYSVHKEKYETVAANLRKCGAGLLIPVVRFVLKALFRLEREIKDAFGY